MTINETPEQADQADLDPTSDELQRELSDAELQSKGLVFAEKYLLYKIILENKYNPKRTIPFEEARDRLRQLFPQQEGEWLPGYLQKHSDAFRIGFDWATAKVYSEWKTLNGQPTNNPTEELALEMLQIAEDLGIDLSSITDEDKEEDGK